MVEENTVLQIYHEVRLLRYYRDLLPLFLTHLSSKVSMVSSNSDISVPRYDVVF